jgi:hypothetical protein
MTDAELPSPLPNARISYRAGLQRLMERANHALDCPRHPLDQHRGHLPCECDLDADLAIGRALAALVAEAEELAARMHTTRGANTDGAIGTVLKLAAGVALGEEGK